MESSSETQHLLEGHGLQETTLVCDKPTEIREIQHIKFNSSSVRAIICTDEQDSDDMSNQTYTRAELRKLEELRRLVGQLKVENELERIKVSEASESFVAFILDLEDKDPLLMKKKPDSIFSCLNCVIG
ncbi:hypothetical protein TCAL_06072 [Tigriopus californicus]|uniref:G protein gamma domain-containing protein n=1 Tax=Tigriopus californicus TaxID=6832 RepID=A0A553P2I7_TIGCA|nr:uncharacterized protein LOC131884037 [Tigriopus californicus]TRY71893.1 hypothetical protein TCAL_06072 [Tigriopus californicus]|eukprot:TCALIF_06072-PA protein Name:"Protein of unknown function" AED:0.01 eAED:0.01 QI:109/1/0.5/1/1/0.5/2/0/128